jgi:hypothetical protein
MTHKPVLPIRWLIAAVLVFGSACILETVSGPAATSQVVYVTATRESGGAEVFTPSPTIDSILDLTATWTLTPLPTNTATKTLVTLTAGQNLSCVKGPHWILYEWVAGIAEGEVVTLLAKSPAEWPDYFYVRKADGTECWTFAASSTISGDTSALPVREAPPLPQITLTIRNQTYLRITTLRMRPKDETVWGTNLLGSHEVKGQETYGLTLTAGFYDLRIQDHHSGVVYEVHDVPIGAEPGSSTIVLNGRYSVNIHSDTTSAMCRVEIDSMDDTYHAELTIPGDGRISPGETVTLEGLGGVYDIQFHRCGDDANWYGTGAYIGPITETVTIL